MRERFIATFIASCIVGRGFAAVRERRFRLLRIALAFAASLGCSTAATAATRTQSAIAEIAKQFDTHPLVMIGELHKSREIHAFLQQLLRDPVFICKADDIVVEFGNSRLQNVADDYVAGKDLPEAQIRSMWRETAVPLTWNSPLYRQFYETVRDINVRHLCAHPIRLVLADPPIDWSKVESVKDFERFADRDGSHADVVEREVLAKNHRALLVTGLYHALKRLPDEWQDAPDALNTAQLIERAHPGALFCIASVPQADAAKALRLGSPLSFRAVRGSELENVNLQMLDEGVTITRTLVDGKTKWALAPDKHWPRMGEAIDGVVYVGGNHSVFPSPAIYLDPVWQRELRRRAAIIKSYNGQDFNAVIDGLVKEAERGRRK